MPDRTITVENTTEHPFDFAATGAGPSYGYVRVPAARMEAPVNNQVVAKKNGAAEVPELLLARLMRERVVRGWFEQRECILVGTTIEALLALELPPEPKTVASTANTVTAAANAKLVEENQAKDARIAELEAQLAKGKSKA